MFAVVQRQDGWDCLCTQVSLLVYIGRYLYLCKYTCFCLLIAHPAHLYALRDLARVCQYNCVRAC